MFRTKKCRKKDAWKSIFHIQHGCRYN